MMNTLELSKSHPAAYADLPECYQADDCLTFWVDANGNLMASPKKDQLDILGNWECMWDKEVGTWVPLL